LFRGDSLDSFDGSTWKSTIFAYKSKDRAQDQRVASRHSQEIVSLTVHREPAPNSTIFYPDILIDVVQQTPSSGEFLFNANGSVIRDIFTLSRYSYMLRIAPPLVEAMIPREPVAHLRDKLSERFTSNPLPFELSARDAQLYRTVPQDVADAAWFHRWVHELGIDPRRDSVVEVASKLARNFQDSFQPSLKNKLSGDNSLQSFLTSDREGHCEFFATAAVLLWRTLGLPARVVVGYRGGAFNHLIDALEVREENAHAWLEVYLPEIGWHSFDPTPGDPPALSESVASMLRMYANAASFFFRQYVIDYDYRTQRDLLRSFRDATRRNQTDSLSLKDLTARATRPMLIALAVIGIAFLVLRRRMDAHDQRHLPRFYRDFERKMRRRGLCRGPGETFAAFHRRCGEGGVDAALLGQVDQSLETELYAGEELSRRQLTALRKEVGRL
jgi:transglutaminase-like putative cysteine protease